MLSFCRVAAGVGIATVVSACAVELNNPSTTHDAGGGLVNLVGDTKLGHYHSAMPERLPRVLEQMLSSPDLVIYDSESVIPGYQDSFGSPEGMRPNTVRSNLIDLAVPGGHARLFREKGIFNFPFGTGGVDRSNNFSKFNFWLPPRDGNGQIIPVAYWRESFSRWHWVFPKGTVMGEVLMLKFPDGDEKVFEIRTRTRQADSWTSDAFRPFGSARELATAIRSTRPNFGFNPELNALVDHLENNSTLTSRSLRSQHFPGSSFGQVDGHEDILPNFGDAGLVKELLTNTPFRSVKGAEWKRDGNKVAFGPTTNEAFGITANGYEGGLFEVSDEFCNKCHADAGRSIGDFHDDLSAYGELWGEDDTFSWHPFKTRNFLRPDGRVNNWNDDNRAVRADFSEAGLVQQLRPESQAAQYYRMLDRDWIYRPF